MKRRRQPRLTLVKPIRFAPDEWTKIEERAKLVALPPSAYVRQTALGYRLSSRINERAIAQLARVGNNLNQLARVANTTGRMGASRRLEEVLKETQRAIMDLAAR